MLKNGFLTAITLAAMVGLAACGGDAEQPEVVEEQAAPITNETEEVAPEVIQGTVVMDTAGAGTIIDTTTAPVDTAGQQ